MIIIKRALRGIVVSIKGYSRYLNKEKKNYTLSVRGRAHFSAVKIVKDRLLSKHHTVLIQTTLLGMVGQV